MPQLFTVTNANNLLRHTQQPKQYSTNEALPFIVYKLERIWRSLSYISVISISHNSVSVSLLLSFRSKLSKKKNFSVLCSIMRFWHRSGDSFMFLFQKATRLLAKFMCMTEKHHILLISENIFGFSTFEKKIHHFNFSSPQKSVYNTTINTILLTVCVIWAIRMTFHNFVFFFSLVHIWKLCAFEADKKTISSMIWVEQNFLVQHNISNRYAEEFNERSFFVDADKMNDSKWKTNERKTQNTKKWR